MILCIEVLLEEQARWHLFHERCFHEFELMKYLMQQLLENEGIIIKENQILDLEKHYWEPIPKK